MIKSVDAESAIILACVIGCVAFVAGIVVGIHFALLILKKD